MRPNNLLLALAQHRPAIVSIPNYLFCNLRSRSSAALALISLSSRIRASGDIFAIFIGVLVPLLPPSLLTVVSNF